MERTRDELDVDAVHLAAVLARMERDVLTDRLELINAYPVFQTRLSSLS